MYHTPEILTLPAQTFIGLEARFISATSPDANNLQIIPALWSRFFPQLTQISTDEPGAYYGLCDHLEAHHLTLQHPDELLYLAAARVAPNAPIPDGMRRWTAPGGTYAQFTHHGNIQKLGQTIANIHGKWLPASNYEPAPGPDFERYDHRFDPTSEDSQLEIYIPIQQA